jgi:hypothetical protein
VARRFRRPRIDQVSDYSDDHVYWTDFDGGAWSATDNGVDEVSQQIRVEVSHAATFDALSFAIGPTSFTNAWGTNTTRVVGYVGFQNSGQYGTSWAGSEISHTDRGAVFSIWGGSQGIRTDAATHWGCWDGGGEGGWGTTCRIPFPWTEGAPVTLRIWRADAVASGPSAPGSAAPVSGTRYQASVTFAGTTTDIGQIFVPNAGARGFSSISNFVEHFGNDGNGCSARGTGFYDRAVLYPPVYRRAAATATARLWPAGTERAYRTCKRQSVNADGSATVVTGELTYNDERWPHPATNRRAIGRLDSSTGAGTSSARVTGTVSLPGSGDVVLLRVRSTPSNTIVSTQSSDTPTSFDLTYDARAMPASDTEVCVDASADGHWCQLGRSIAVGGHPWATGRITSVEPAVGALRVRGYADVAGFGGAVQIRPRIDGMTVPGLLAFTNIDDGVPDHPFGFDLLIAAAAGPHTMCIEANSNGTWTALDNCVRVIVT